MTRLLFLCACLAAATAWCWLYFTSRGILYEGYVDERTSTLVCNYFTGVGTARREYRFAPSGQIGGRDVCPRTVSFSQ